MNKQEKEKAICAMENLRHLLIDVLGNKNNEKEFDVAIEMPEKQLTNGWIPVSERLPKEGRYLVTTAYGEVKESEFDLKKWWQIDNSTISLEWEEEPIKVVAWQPLPEPYKELATDNNVVTKSGKDNKK